MPIQSVVITESPVTNSPEFSESISVGAPNQWLNYSHETRAMGGFWKCRFDLLANKGSSDYLEEYLYRGLGRHVVSYTASGFVAWEGYIDRLRYTLPGVKMETSLTNMGNKVWYRFLTDEDGLLARSSEAEDLALQDRWGIKEIVKQGGIMPNALAANQAAEAHLAKYKNPATPSISLKQGTTPTQIEKLEVFCKGYIHALGWRVFNDTTVTTKQNANLQIKDIIDDVGQFVQSYNLATNTTQVDRLYDRDETALSLIMNISRLADSNNLRHIVGMYKDRELIYEPIKDIDSDITVLKYLVSVRDNLQSIRETGSNQPVDPALVRPNNWMRISDVLGSWQSANQENSQDPQVNFVETVLYREPFNIRVLGSRADQGDNVFVAAATQDAGDM